MGELIKWTNKALSENKVDPFIIISLFAYEFIRIHPFIDGNGRVSRILMTFLFIRAGYTFLRYAPFEQAIEYDKWLYFRCLFDALTKQGTGNERISKWVLFLTYVMQKLIKDMIGSRS